LKAEVWPVASEITGRVFAPDDGSDAAWFRVQTIDGCAVVTARGEIDLHTAPWLRSALVHAENQSAHVVVDLAEVRLLDSTGVGAILAGLKGVHAVGGSMSLAGATGVVRRVLEHTQLERVCAIHQDVAEAIASSTRMP
jgi:anti-sigma B factor antagonist